METFLNPQEVIRKLKLRKGLSVADFGSGSGGWVLPIAEIVQEGTVYAVDILDEPLSALRAKAEMRRLANIRFAKGNVESLEGSTLIRNSCDFVLMTNLLFEVESKEAVFDEAKRVLKPRGKILIVDWKEGASAGPSEGRVKIDDLKKLAKKKGFNVLEEFDASAFHFGLILSCE